MPSVTEAKREYEARLNSLMTKYSKVLFLQVDNVRSQQIHEVRRDLRGKAVFLMGKKTLQAKCIDLRAASDKATDTDRAFHESCNTLNLLKGNSGLLFTNADLKEVSDILDKHRIQAPARVGAVAPCDVVIPAGNTGMEPTMTSFFQALNIATKIAKGTVEIINDKKVLSQGEKVDNSTATLLQKLKISPFYYQLEVICVWDRGVVFTKADLSITDETVEKYLLEGISNVTALSLGAGIPTAATLPIVLADAFKTLLAASVATDYEFTEYNGAKLRKDAKEGKLGGGAAAPAAAASAAPAAAAAAPAKGKEKEKEPEPEEEEDFGMGGLF